MSKNQQRFNCCLGNSCSSWQFLQCNCHHVKECVCITNLENVNSQMINKKGRQRQKDSLRLLNNNDKLTWLKVNEGERGARQAQRKAHSINYNLKGINVPL